LKEAANEKGEEIGFIFYENNEQLFFKMDGIIFTQLFSI